jgi:CRP-like cAMP-binding protein
MSSIILPRTSILSFMDDESREQFATYGTVMETTPGQVIIQQGVLNLQLFIVIKGTFAITTDTSGHPVHLDSVGVGDCLGEVAVFEPGVASATVTCTEAGQLWFIDVEHLQQFLLEWPHSGCAAILGITTILSRRLKRANNLIRSNEILPSFLSVRSRKRVEGANPG